MTQEPGSGLHIGHSRFAERLGYDPVHGGVIGQPRVRGHRAQEHVVIGRAGPLAHHVAGGQYLAIRYRARLAEAGAIASAGPERDGYDNTLAETIIGLYKAELIRHRGPWHSVPGAGSATAWWVGWFNTQRLFGPLGGIPPAEYEQNWLEGQQP